MKILSGKYTKDIENALVEKITVIIYSSEDENSPKYSEDDQMKDFQQTLNSINDFLLLSLISYVGSQLKLLWMSCYRIMKKV